MSLLAHKHVVIVEDETATLRSLIPIFHHEKCRVSKAVTGTEALETIASCMKKKDTIDLVLCDINLPGLKGWELQEKLLEQKIQLPFLFMTGDHSRRIKTQLEEKGCHHLLKKPFGPKELLDSAEKTLHAASHHSQHKHVPK